MRTITLKDVLRVIQNTINSVDGRLTNHGEQVAFLCLRMGRELEYPEDRLVALCSLASVHDIGAYKVEERRRMVEFEVTRPHEHAVYGYLFLRQFSPLAPLADTVLFHHYSHQHRSQAPQGKAVPPESLLIHLADRVSVLHGHHGTALTKAVRQAIPTMAGTVFDPQHTSLLLRLTRESDVVDRLLDGSYLDELYSYLGRMPLTFDQVNAYLGMLVYAIEFRSRQTVTHTVSVVSAAGQVGRLLGMPHEELVVLQQAALLHDVGKITTPLEILTKPGKLNEVEAGIMRRHVVATEEILTEAGFDDVRDVAVSHHEKPNGKGYPRGLEGDQISLGGRVLAIADMLAALVEPRYYKPALSKAEVLAIMDRAAEAGDIDARLYSVVPANYDRMVARMQREQETMLALYEQMASEYGRLLEQIYSATNTPVDTDVFELRFAA